MSAALQSLPPGRIDWDGVEPAGPMWNEGPAGETDEERQRRFLAESVAAVNADPDFYDPNVNYTDPVDPTLQVAPENVPVPKLEPDPLMDAAYAAVEAEPAGDDGGSGGPALPQADEDLPPMGGAPAGSSVIPVRRATAAADAAQQQESPGPVTQKVALTLGTLPAGSIDFWEEGRWRDPTMGERLGATADYAVRAVRRGSLLDDLAGELEAEQPNAARVVELQRQIEKLGPSPEFKRAMDDRLTPGESWEAFKAAPERVVSELVLESLSSFAKQMFEKAPARVAIGAGAGAGAGFVVGGVGAGPGAAIGGSAGFAESAGAASYALEMSGGILEALEEAGVNMGSPEELRAAFEDPERMALAREFAQKKAIPIAVTDTALALIAGRVVGKKNISKLGRLWRGAVELGIQSAGGAGGEAAGQLVQKGAITSPRAVIAEAVAEIGPGSVEIAAGTIFARGQQPKTGAANLPTGGRVAFEEGAPVTPQGPPDTAPNAGPTAPAAATAEAPKRVVVEADDVFGEPTTTAVEEPAAAPVGDERFAPPVTDEAERTAGPAVPTEETAGTTASVPMMITRQMEADLLARGMTQQEINRLTPQQAQDILAQPMAAAEPADAGGGAATAEPRTNVVRNRTNLVQNRTNAGQTVTNRVETATNAVAPAEPTVKPPKKLYRGEAPNQWDPNVRGMGTFALGKGLYSTTDKKFAGMYGEVKQVSPEEYWPRNPLVLPGTGDAAGLLATYIARNTNFRNIREFNAAYPDPGQFVREQGFDGIIAGNEVVKYVDEAPAAGAVTTQQTTDGGDAAATPTAAAAPSPAKASKARARIKKMTSQSGAIDVSILEDIVEYGQTVYRAGMEYATWAAAMVREFGQGVAQFLRQAFDRIVAAYRDSIYSDETGAIGGRRPVRFKRSIAQLEELAKDSAAFRTWFDDFRTYLEQDFLAEFPEYAPLVNEFLSATSAATSVAANVPIMVKELRHFLETGEIRTNFEAHAKNLQRAAAGQKLEGPKISEYSDAVFGNPDAIPVDRHIAQIMFGVKAPSARQIAAAKRRIREIALRLNWQPRQVMAALWAANQRLNNQPSESYERHLERYKGELLSILAADRAGEGRGLQASRRIAERISAARRTEGSSGDGITDGSGSAQEAQSKAAKARVKRKLTGESGAIDVSIIEDLVVYGRTVYRAGMDLATWSAQMVREFGQGVAQFLRQAFDRIVAAYRASRFSDTTGAVGDVRPGQRTKPRQFEEKAMRNEALAAETRARLGSEYLPISLNAQAEAAKEWINTNGLDAAKLRIAQLSGEDSVPTPLDFAIGIEAAGRLSAAGDHQGAADIVSTMSHRATGMGQTISTLAMMARLSPEGIVFYGENIIRRYINALPPEAQDRIRALQAEVARLKAELAKAKFDQGSEVIRSGKLGDEKIQDRIKRRQRAKVEADLGPDATGPEVTAETKARTQRMNRAVRDVLLGDSTRAEATKAIEAILLEQGNLSASEAAAMARSIADAFFKLMRETRTRLTNEAKGRGGRAGGFDRLLAALREGKDLSDADFLGELSRLLGLPGMTPAMARELRAIGQRYERATDPDVRLVLAAQMYEKAHELVPADFWVKVRGFAYLSMLFAPKTWIRNVVGNQIQWIANVGRDAFVTGILDPAISMFTGQRTSAGLKLGARLKGLLAPISDVRRGYLWSKQENPSFNHFRNFMEGVNHLRLLSKLSSQNKYEISDVRSVNGRIFSSGFMRAWEGALSIALGAGDRAFWMSQFRASLAQMQAAAERNGEWSGQPTPEMIEAAMAEAAYAIYQNPNLLSQGGAKVRAVLNRLTTAGRTDQFGLGTALMAFTQVPGSIAMRGILDWSPLGFIRAMYQGMRGVLYASSDGRRGAKFDQAEFNKTFTQALLGTGGMYAAGFWLYSLGIITASREDDEDLEAMRRASGLGAYRINLTALRRALLSMNWFTPQPPQDGDLIVTYDWAQPVAITVAAGAEYAAMLERAERSAMKKGLAERASMPVMSLVAGAKSLEELPLLSGLMSFMQAAGQRAPAGESSLANALIKTVTGLPSMFVPQLVRQATQLSDNMVRTTRAGVAAEREFDRVLASLPGWSTKYPVRFDVTGQAIERYQYAGNTVWNVLTNPALMSRYKADPVLQEVGRLLNATGETGVVPREVLRKAKINGKDVELTNNQIAAYQYYVGNFTMSHFRWRMAAPVYARLPDELKAKMLTDDLKDIHAAVKSAVLGADPRRLTRRQMFLRQALVNSPLGRSVPPR